VTLPEPAYPGAAVYTTIDSPLGELLLVGEWCATAPGGTALASLSVPDQRGGASVQDGWVRDADAFAGIAAQLASYFEGHRTRFEITFAHGGGRGSAFRRTVWKALEEIPYGSTVSYGELTARIGAPRASARAVGAAIGANPLLVVRPCHRVIGAGGALTGYAGGLDRKRLLLMREGALADA
jgi:methylated-DNA-[protein]-cysteine S-methyltransferase